MSMKSKLGVTTSDYKRQLWVGGIYRKLVFRLYRGIRYVIKIAKNRRVRRGIELTGLASWFSWAIDGDLDGFLIGGNLGGIGEHCDRQIENSFLE